SGIYTSNLRCNTREHDSLELRQQRLCDTLLPDLEHNVQVICICRFWHRLCHENVPNVLNGTFNCGTHFFVHKRREQLAYRDNLAKLCSWYFNHKLASVSLGDLALLRLTGVTRVSSGTPASTHWEALGRNALRCACKCSTAAAS